MRWTIILAALGYSAQILTPIFFGSVTVDTPAFSPVQGIYTTTQSVTISTVLGGTSIFYTVDGSTPTTGSTPYSGAISVSVTTTIKALATKTGFNNSAIGTAVYTITSLGVTGLVCEVPETATGSITCNIENGSTYPLVGSSIAVDGNDFSNLNNYTVATSPVNTCSPVQNSPLAFNGATQKAYGWLCYVSTTTNTGHFSITLTESAGGTHNKSLAAVEITGVPSSGFSDQNMIALHQTSVTACSPGTIAVAVQPQMILEFLISSATAATLTAGTGYTLTGLPTTGNLTPGGVYKIVNATGNQTPSINLGGTMNCNSMAFGVHS